MKNGDIVKIDVGAFYKGYHGDCAATFAVGSVSDEARRLIEVTEDSFYKGIEQALPEHRIGDIGAAIEGFVRENGFTVVRDFIGHGVGEKLHEDPEVPNFGVAGRGVRLRSGMTIAVEMCIRDRFISTSSPESRVRRAASSRRRAQSTPAKCSFTARNARRARASHIR